MVQQIVELEKCIKVMGFNSSKSILLEGWEREDLEEIHVS